MTSTRTLQRRLNALGSPFRSALEDLLEDIARNGRRIGDPEYRGAHKSYRQVDPDEVNATLKKLAQTRSTRTTP